MDGDITLICPRGAKPGQQLLFRDESGARFSTELPAGVTAGMKFTAKRNRPPRPGSGTQRRENPMGASFRGRDGQEFRRVPSATKLFQRPPTPAVLNSARPSSGRSRPPSSARSRGPATARSSRPPSSRRALPPVPDYVDEPLGDQAWWEQWGFKGSMSEDKKRDYGNGVPKWSPYHRMNEELQGENCGLPADAFWFQQWGFRTASLSEEAIKCQGYGVPSWSPYYDVVAKK